jgi:hypothetical protein
MATMPRAATRTPPISVLRQTSNHAARLRRYIPLFETRRRSRRVFCLISTVRASRRTPIAGKCEKIWTAARPSPVSLRSPPSPTAQGCPGN